MKTFIFSALALGMMASCSNTEVEGIDAVDNGCLLYTSPSPRD